MIIVQFPRQRHTGLPRFVAALVVLQLLMSCSSTWAQQKPPNIVVIMSDDVGIWNVGAYSRGMMGGSTPNIDRIAKEGALFTDYYAQQSCTAGRAAFILGQCPFRTGLLKVGLPAAKQGSQDTDPTIAQLLKPYGYATAQIGKNHLGDRNEYLPTVHGFDEFYGILYHLNAMEEPYEPDYPKTPGFKEMFGPRDIVDTHATDVDARANRSFQPVHAPLWPQVRRPDRQMESASGHNSEMIASAPTSSRRLERAVRRIFLNPDKSRQSRRMI